MIVVGSGRASVRTPDVDRMGACCELRTAHDVIQSSAVQYIFFAFSILTTFGVLCVATGLPLKKKPA